MNGFRLMFGLFFVVIGILALLAAINAISLSWDYFWPLFILVPGLAFEFSYFNRKSKDYRNAGILVPGGILLTVSVIFYINIFFGWHLMEYMWPLFILAPAIGLFQLYFFGKRNKGVLMATGILAGIGFFALIINLLRIDFFVYIFSIGLIAVGVYFIFRGIEPSKKR